MRDKTCVECETIIDNEDEITIVGKEDECKECYKCRLEDGEIICKECCYYAKEMNNGGQF